MTRLYLVRHGHAAAGWADDLDPGLDDSGREQATEAARGLRPMGPLAIVTSPLARARETAAPLVAERGVEARIEEGVGEVPSPGLGLKARGRWLGTLMASRWPDLGPGLQAWRDRVIAALLEIEADAAVFTHFIAINVAVGAAVGDERVVVFAPGNGSVTVAESGPDGLRLIERGAEADPVVG